jgi:hypothetical protein
MTLGMASRSSYVKNSSDLEIPSILDCQSQDSVLFQNLKKYIQDREMDELDNIQCCITWCITCSCISSVL